MSVSPGDHHVGGQSAKSEAVRCEDCVPGRDDVERLGDRVARLRETVVVAAQDGECALSQKQDRVR